MGDTPEFEQDSKPVPSIFQVPRPHADQVISMQEAVDADKACVICRRPDDTLLVFQIFVKDRRELPSIQEALAYLRKQPESGGRLGYSMCKPRAAGFELQPPSTWGLDISAQPIQGEDGSFIEIFSSLDFSLPPTCRVSDCPVVNIMRSTDLPPLVEKCRQRCEPLMNAKLPEFPPSGVNPSSAEEVQSDHPPPPPPDVTTAHSSKDSIQPPEGSSRLTEESLVVVGVLTASVEEVMHLYSQQSHLPDEVDPTLALFIRSSEGYVSWFHARVPSDQQRVSAAKGIVDVCSMGLQDGGRRRYRICQCTLLLPRVFLRNNPPFWFSSPHANSFNELSMFEMKSDGAIRQGVDRELNFTRLPVGMREKGLDLHEFGDEAAEMLSPLILEYPQVEVLNAKVRQELEIRNRQIVSKRRCSTPKPMNSPQVVQMSAISLNLATNLNAISHMDPMASSSQDVSRSHPNSFNQEESFDNSVTNVNTSHPQPSRDSPAIPSGIGLLPLREEKEQSVKASPLSDQIWLQRLKDAFGDEVNLSCTLINQERISSRINRERWSDNTRSAECWMPPAMVEPYRCAIIRDRLSRLHDEIGVIALLDEEVGKQLNESFTTVRDSVARRVDTTQRILENGLLSHSTLLTPMEREDLERRLRERHHTILSQSAFSGAHTTDVIQVSAPRGLKRTRGGVSHTMSRSELKSTQGGSKRSTSDHPDANNNDNKRPRNTSFNMPSELSLIGETSQSCEDITPSVSDTSTMSARDLALSRLSPAELQQIAANREVIYIRDTELVKQHRDSILLDPTRSAESILTQFNLCEAAPAYIPYEEAIRILNDEGGARAGDSGHLVDCAAAQVLRKCETHPGQEPKYIRWRASRFTLSSIPGKYMISIHGLHNKGAFATTSVRGVKCVFCPFCKHHGSNTFVVVSHILIWHYRARIACRSCGQFWSNTETIINHDCSHVSRFWPKPSSGVGIITEGV